MGVVRGAKYSKVDEKTPREVYLAFAQDDNPSSLVVYARTADDPKTLFAALRREVTALDSALPITDLRTMDDQIDESLSAQRAMAGLSAFFGILATLLAAIGLYGVMAYTVTRRTREIGIRLALGAGRGSLLTLVLREVALLTLAGVAIAIPVALAITRLVRSRTLRHRAQRSGEYRRGRGPAGVGGSGRGIHPGAKHAHRPEWTPYE